MASALFNLADDWSPLDSMADTEHEVEWRDTHSEALLAFHRLYHACEGPCDAPPPTGVALAQEAARVTQSHSERGRLLASLPDTGPFFEALEVVIAHPAFMLFLHELRFVQAQGDHDQYADRYTFDG